MLYLWKLIQVNVYNNNTSLPLAICDEFGCNIHSEFHLDNYFTVNNKTRINFMEELIRQP